MKKINIIYTSLCLLVFASCADYLDVVPEGTAQIENAFSTRTVTMRYLYTCYSYLPGMGSGSSFELMGCDELWTFSAPEHPNGGFSLDGFKIAEGRQSTSQILYDRWEHYYKAIRDCNVFIDGLNTYTIPDLPEYEKEQWIAEAKVLKAWYHFLLLRQYGPIPIIKENIPVTADIEVIKVARNSVDEVTDYIVELFDEAIPNLPPSVRVIGKELGRIVSPIALSMKAQVLVTAASPLFNCNTELKDYKNKDGKQLFPQDESKKQVKWQRAADACSKAVDVCVNELGMSLYIFPGDAKLSPQSIQEMTLRNAFNERWNSEIIWADTKSGWQTEIQRHVIPKINFRNTSDLKCIVGVPLKIAEMFYSNNGVPIDEDKTWNYNGRYNLRVAVDAERRLIHNGGVTARLNFDREPRFYAWLGFDQSVWYGQGVFDDANPSNLLYLNGFRATSFSTNNWQGPVTGYVPKKWIHYQSYLNDGNSYSLQQYIWPYMRLSELLLYYAEALNEADDNSIARQQAMQEIDRIRERAGLSPVAEAWTNFSNKPNKFNSQTGLREIIQRERLIELCFEGKRYWDLRRWKTAPEVINRPIQGWNLSQTVPALYYRPVTMFDQTFFLRDYFFPIPEGDLVRNKNLIQSIGW